LPEQAYWESDLHPDLAVSTMSRRWRRIPADSRGRVQTTGRSNPQDLKPFVPKVARHHPLRNRA
jgi:hypothetical protein